SCMHGLRYFFFPFMAKCDCRPDGGVEWARFGSGVGFGEEEFARYLAQSITQGYYTYTFYPFYKILIVIIYFILIILLALYKYV
ncbi:hypothetical protein ACJX0J_034775, partial [Zea mays]